MESKIRIQDLYIYPVKSLGGKRVSSFRIGERGPMFDRWWMLVDEKGAFQTQRQLPQLSQLLAEVIDGTRVEIHSGSDFMDFGVDEANGETLEVKIWGQICLAEEVDQEVSSWISDQVGKKLKLVKIKDGFTRSVDEKYGPGQVSFADGFPFMVLTQQSLDLLNQKMGRALAMSRFRPNIVICTEQAHEEDQWEKLEVGQVVLRGTKSCVRCKVITINPLQGQFAPDGEPLKTLAEYRKTEDGIIFGKNFVHENQGELRVGQEVTVITDGSSKEQSFSS